MHPAFRTTKSAVAFGLLLLILLTLPKLVEITGLPTRDQAYSALPVQNSGSVAFFKHTLYEEVQNADVLFVGASLIRQGILAHQLETSLGHALGRKIRVRVLAPDHSGMDQEFFLIRDYLAKHKPGLLVLNQETPSDLRNDPHPNAHWFIRSGELPGHKNELPLLARVQLYGETVLGAPRQLLNKVRPNLIGDQEFHDGEIIRNSDSTAASLVLSGVPRAQALEESSPLFEYTPATAGASYQLAPYELYFMRRIAELVKSSGTKLVLMHVPPGEELGKTKVPELKRWSEIFGPGIRNIAMPCADLFRAVDSKLFYQRDGHHLNELGAARWTAAVTPAIQSLLTKEEASGSE